MFGVSLPPLKFGVTGKSCRNILAAAGNFGSFFLNFGRRKVYLPRSELNSLQRDFLDLFFKHKHGFFLTGGAALVGYYFGHRETHDLDLFTLRNEIEEGFRLVNEIARDLKGTVEPLQTSPDFRRLLLKRGDQAIVIDLVRDYVFQVQPEKPVIDGIRLDPPEEILANKLCALLSRSEIRDLVDVRELENAGFGLDSALETAARKDSGLTAAQLAWVLALIKINEGAELPGGVPAPELRAYLRDLVDRLRRIAMPEQ
jgi:hypothetical protein